MRGEMRLEIQTEEGGLGARLATEDFVLQATGDKQKPLIRETALWVLPVMARRSVGGGGKRECSTRMGSPVRKFFQ